MFKRIVICLDGSQLAERIIPYACGLAESAKAKIKILRIVDYGEDFTAVAQYVKAWGESLSCPAEVVKVQHAVASTLLAELWSCPGDLPALTTRGHAGIMEPVLGSTALAVIRKLGGPVFVIHPIADKTTLNYHVHSIIAALDGSRYSEKILPYAAQLAQVLKLNLELIQAIPGGREIPPEIKQDVLEDAYLAPRAHHLEKEFGVRVKWDVLHGPPAKAICSYVSGRKDALLAMTSHARRPVEHALLGSVTSACVRGAEIPLLIEGFNERESLYEAAI